MGNDADPFVGRGHSAQQRKRGLYRTLYWNRVFFSGFLRKLSAADLCQHSRGQSGGGGFGTYLALAGRGHSAGVCAYLPVLRALHHTAHCAIERNLPKTV